MAGSHGNSWYFNTENVRQERFGQWQAFRVHSAEIDDEVNNGLFDKIAAANAEPANFDQAGQLARRPDHDVSLACIQKDTVIPDQDGLGYLPRAPGKDEIERQPGLAGS